MSNCNTFCGVYNLAGPVSATETAVQAPVGVLTPLGASTASTPLRQLISPGGNANLDKIPFRIRAIAEGVATGSSNFTLKLYWNSAANTNLTTFTGDVLLLGSSTQALASAAGTIVLAADLYWDATAKQLACSAQTISGFANIVTTPAVITLGSNISATNPIKQGSGVATSDLLQFFATMTCGTAANVTSTTLVELSLERV